MKFRKPLLAVLVTASLAGLSFSQSGIALEISFNTAPPPAKYEVVPPPRKGYTWAPGYWDAKGNKHAWSKGHWEKDRAGHHYVESRWVQKDTKWSLERGRWNAGDRDGDGVPNNRDRQPDNPNRK
jgi:WXXGXW repeat (2 copies)